MKQRSAIAGMGLLILAGFGTAQAQEESLALPVCCTEDFLKPTLAASAGMDARLAEAGKDGEGLPVLRLTVRKGGSERRFLALETRPAPGTMVSFKAYEMRTRVRFSDGVSARPAMLFHESDGGAWFAAGAPLPNGGAAATVRSSLTSLRQPAFSDDADGAPTWSKTDRIWFGFLLDGAGEGTAEIGSLILTSRPFTPEAPLPLFRSSPEEWLVSADPAVRHDAKPATGPDGGRSLRFEFTFPGGKHMYFVPAQAVPETEMTAYKGIRIRYEAALPPGLNGLLVSVFERSGSQYVAAPPPPATGRPESVILTWDRFELGGWSRDPEEGLDPNSVNRMSIGAHGVPTGNGGDGYIEIRGIELVP